MDTLYAQGIEMPDEDDDVLNRTIEDDERFLDRIMADLAWAESFYSIRNDMMKRHVKWFYGQHYEDENTSEIGVQSASTDGAEHLVTINIPFSSVMRAHTMMTNEEPAIEVLGKRAKKGSVEQFLYGTYYVNTQRWGSHPMYDAIFDQLLKGWGVVRTTWNRDRYEDEDESFEGDRPDYEFPIEVCALDPQEVYPIPGGTRERWKAIIHKTRRRVFEVEDEWGVTLHPSDLEMQARVEAKLKDPNAPDPNEPLDPNNEIDFIDYWAWEGNRIMHAVVANQQYVHRPTYMKYYDSLPFTIFFCTKTTERQRGEYFGLPANFGLVDSVAELEWIVNRQMRITDMYADPVTIFIRNNENPIGDMIESGIVELSAGESASYLQFTGATPDLGNLNQFFRQQVEEEGFALPRSGESGLDTIALQQAGLIKIFKPVENAEQAWENVNSKIIGLFQRYSWTKPVQVVGRREGGTETDAWSFSLKGKDTKNLRNSRVRIRAKFPLEELRNAATANILVNGELFPREMAMKRFLHIQDTEEAMEMIDRDRVRRDPQISQTLVQMRLKELMESSSVMSLVEEAMQDGQGEENQVLGRTSEQTAGTPENPAPLLGTPLGQEESRFQAGVEEGQSGMMMGMQDNPAPDMGGIPRG